MHTKFDSDVTSSVVPSSPRSPKRQLYYVQSPSRDSHDGDKSSSMQATPAYSSPLLKKYYQPRKSRRTAAVTLHGEKVPLYEAGASLAVSDDGGGVSMKLIFEVRSRGNVVGKLVKSKHRKRISCSLVIDSRSNKPLKLNIVLANMTELESDVHSSLGKWGV